MGVKTSWEGWAGSAHRDLFTFLDVVGVSIYDGDGGGAGSAQREVVVLVVIGLGEGSYRSNRLGLGGVSSSR